MPERGVGQLGPLGPGAFAASQQREWAALARSWKTLSTPPDRGPLLEAVAAEVSAWEREGMRLVTVLDDDYPLYLRLVHQRPPFLLLRGAAAEDDLRVAVVGTRQPTPEEAATPVPSPADSPSVASRS
ncbi:DNA-processing protein DprA [Streptomyces sp. NPDC019224]|uniref:DNA-processing protein DprA n=1 Tax=Streptomyces sp. NPDC019224 TaxID=3154484 RepID=UPI0033EAC30F